MMEHEISCWPLALSVSQGAPSLDDLHGYSAAWNAWLDRQQRFATLRVLLDSAAHVHPPGGARERKDWLAANGARLQAQVIGMATVAPADVVAQMNRVKTERLFGVPAQAFDSLDAALAWLLPLLEQAIPGHDGAAVRQRVQAWQQRVGMPAAGAR